MFKAFISALFLLCLPFGAVADGWIKKEGEYWLVIEKNKKRELIGIFTHKKTGNETSGEFLFKLPIVGTDKFKIVSIDATVGDRKVELTPSKKYKPTKTHTIFSIGEPWNYYYFLEELQTGNPIILKWSDGALYITAKGFPKDLVKPTPKPKPKPIKLEDKREVSNVGALFGLFVVAGLILAIYLTGDKAIKKSDLLKEAREEAAYWKNEARKIKEEAEEAIDKAEREYFRKGWERARAFHERHNGWEEKKERHRWEERQERRYYGTSDREKLAYLLGIDASEQSAQVWKRARKAYLFKNHPDRNPNANPQEVAEMNALWDKVFS